MDVERSQPPASTDLAQHAEALVRSLAGVSDARVTVGPRGIVAIEIVARDIDSARDMPGRVRSALLAGLATPVLPTRIHVRVSDPRATRADTRAATTTNGHDASGHRVRLIDHHIGPSTRTPTHYTTPAPDPPPAERARAPGHEQQPRAAAARAPQPERYLDRPRLVSVDTERRPDGRVRCRVAIAFASGVHSAEAIAIDLPGAAAQTAAQATVRALADAGITGLELNGLREVEIAGRDYLVVALRRTDTAQRHRSGSAPVIGSAERSAAEATVVAANELI